MLKIWIVFLFVVYLYKINNLKINVMSNLIFCESIDDKFLEIVSSIVKDRTVIDCGAGRGLFGSLWNHFGKGKVISIDLEMPNAPISKIIEANSEHYCFPVNSVPI